MDNRGIDTDLGWVQRKFQAIQREIEALRSERRAAATGVSEGDFTVSGGGSLNVRDGGAIRVLYDGGVGTAITLANQAIIAMTPLGDQRFFLDMSPSTLDALAVTGMDAISLYSTTGSGVAISNNQYPNPGVHIKAVSGDNVYLDALTTTSATSNLHVDAVTGIVSRSTSARKYKQDITDHDINPAAVLKMRVRTWRDRAEVKRDNSCQRRYIGFIAEELHDLGLTEFVTYDDDNRPDAIAYDRLSVALLAVLKSQQAQIDDLAAKVAALTPPTTTTGSL